ncbi:MAG: DUF3131 domain-containing protein [Candidatus Omnitrophica bacterium]|nr:DUF3131 domain-containing protein [Candidatus Omnitrophota bacterium]
MKKLQSLIVLIFLTSAAGQSCVYAERQVQVAQAQNSGEAVIDDFEGEGPKNQLGGENGTWNLTPDHPDISVTNETVDGGASDSKKALKITYEIDVSGIAKVGYWTKLRDFDATRYDHLAFDVKGDPEAGFTSVLMVEIKKYKNDQRLDKIKGSYVVQNVTDHWQTVQIPLNMFTGLFDQTNPKVWENPMIARKNLDELVINLENRRVSKKKGALYFDHFRFVKTGHPGPNIIEQPPRKGMKTPVPLEGVEFAKFLVNRLQGYPSTLLPEKHFPEDDKAFLTMIAEDTWKFFDHIVDHEHQLPLDTIQLGQTQPIAPDGWVGDYTNVTNIGLYLMCVLAAHDLNFINRPDAVRRIKATLDRIEKLERHESGFLYNYYDTTTLERTSHFISLVDSGWLDAGVYVIKNAFPELKQQCEEFLAGHHFSFFYDEVEQQMTHGFFAHLGVRSDYHYGSFYQESRIASYIAIGRGDVPLEHWFRTNRTFPEEYGWQNQIPIDREERTTLGFTYYGGHYEWKGIPYVPSWGGSMFEGIMPTLVLDEAAYAPEGLGLNDKNYVNVHIRYTLEELGYPVWGMSPSSVPEGGYSEFGAKVLGSKGYKAGVVSPHAAILALEFAPRETIQNLRELIRRYPIYGEYGFYDAVTVETGKVARKYLALDQAMILLTINNYLSEAAMRKRFHADPINEKALPLLTEEKFFEKSKALGSQKGS